jgi:hypothetical protein
MSSLFRTSSRLATKVLPRSSIDSITNDPSQRFTIDKQDALDVLRLRDSVVHFQNSHRMWRYAFHAALYSFILFKAHERTIALALKNEKIRDKSSRFLTAFLLLSVYLTLGAHAYRDKPLVKLCASMHLLNVTFATLLWYNLRQAAPDETMYNDYWRMAVQESIMIFYCTFYM